MTAQTTARVFSDLADQAEKIARQAREIADAHTEREKDLAGFHHQSAARAAAVVLLDSTQWLTRSEIAKASGCQPNAVVGVAARLRRNGVTVHRRVLNGQAYFLTGKDEPV